jgi:outer membrane protein
MSTCAAARSGCASARKRRRPLASARGIQARFDVGEITRTNVAQAEARLAAAQASLASARSTLGIAARPTPPWSARTRPTSRPNRRWPPCCRHVDEAFSAAEKNNAQVRAAQRTEEASRARVTAARAGRRPTVSATASVGYNAAEVTASARSSPTTPRRSDTGLTATIPLFTGGLTSSQIRAAIERNNADRIAVETARRSVLQAVSQAWNQVLGARANLVSNQEQVRASPVAFEGVQRREPGRLRTTLDVLNAEQELRSAQLALVTARRDEYVASANRAVGHGPARGQEPGPEVPQYDPLNNFQAASHAIGWVPWEPVIEAVDRVGGPARAPPRKMCRSPPQPRNP